ncbi:glycosyl hydrolase-like protein family 88 [Dendryphion nanum]|uniref:Glycosyl hydrolase-like protein family 88 n=1 Tax=Dendryphion nanum TaxID=256645 RepID=A0A9P9E425_9PLEO|nr:glycosyl hydrolase-like protein family 88 [Dendryphion nanum]
MHCHSLPIALLALASPTLSLSIRDNASLPYSTWMATSFLSKSQPLDRHYVASVIHEGIQKAATLHSNSSLLEYTSKAVSALVTSNGTLIGWNPTRYSIDDLRIGNNLLYFWDSEGRKDEKYAIAAGTLRQQINSWPRTPSGGFWHRQPTYPNQMWLDGIYMAETFYATYTSYFEPDNTTAWNEIALQFDLIEAATRNKTSNLLVHGFDESKTAVWADPVTGACPHVWDRAVGWYFMALVEVLQVYPSTLPGYARLQGYLTTLADGVAKAQDESGGWWLVMDEPYPGMKGNYIESSATAMFTYGYLKGVRTGLLEEKYRDNAVKAYDLMLDRFVTKEANGTLSFEGTVTVGSLSSNGSYEYYIGVPILKNDGKGAGPFMFASTEVELWRGI